jgi:hypothetical protein
MHTKIIIGDDWLTVASKLIPPLDRSAVVHEVLNALIQWESRRRLALLGSTQPADGLDAAAKVGRWRQWLTTPKYSPSSRSTDASARASAMWTATRQRRP